MYPERKRGQEPLKFPSPVKITFPPNPEAQSQLVKLRSSLLQANNIYFCMDGPQIGDTVISTAHFRAFMQGISVAAELSHQDTPPVTLILNKRFADLFQNVSPHPYEVKTVATPEYGMKLADFYFDRSRSVYLDFAGYRGVMAAMLMAIPTTTHISEQSYGERDVVKVKNLTNQGLGNYRFPHRAEHTTRYRDFIADLLQVPKSSIDNTLAQPTITLPEHKDKTIKQLRQQNGYSIKSPQGPSIAIISETTMASKRYSLDNWAETIRLMQQEIPDVHVSFIYNHNGIKGLKKRMDIVKALRKAGVAPICDIISGSLLEVATLLETQTAVISNDTGLGHVSAALGVPTTVIESPVSYYNSTEWRSSPRMHFVSETEHMPTVIDFNTAINYVPPHIVADQALRDMLSV